MDLVFDKTISKRPCIYKRVEPNTIIPVLYFQKAKNASDEEFEAVVKYLLKSQ